ncbi:MAG: MATE family efflux transporter, partial [Muribaculaceae bacterium]|nr:MATE family efflux transporter [Muribaculaceae bacterium]
MKENSAAGLDYAGGKVNSLFMKMFVPTLFGLIFNALITIADGVFVGQGVGPNGIAAVNIIAPLFMVVTGSGLMFGIGASVIAGIAIAQGDSRRACVNMTQG